MPSFWQSLKGQQRVPDDGRFFLSSLLQVQDCTVSTEYILPTFPSLICFFQRVSTASPLLTVAVYLIQLIATFDLRLL